MARAFTLNRIFKFITPFILAGTLAGCDNSNASKKLSVAENNSQIQALEQAKTSKGFIENAAAHWLTVDQFAVANLVTADRFELRSVDASGAAQTVELSKNILPSALANKFPHLSQFVGLTLDAKITAKSLLKNDNVILFYRNDKIVARSRIQQAAVLDSIYADTTGGAASVDGLGASVLEDGVEFIVWAPTALSVEVLLFDDNLQAIGQPLAMAENTQNGIWSLSTDLASDGTFYQYRVNVFHPRTGKFETLDVTDPYSLSLATNSTHSQVVDLSAEYTKPKGWDSHNVPVVEAPEDLILYETHIRDFSAFDKKLSNPQARGKYAAFEESDSDGMRHLLRLQKAGLNVVHLLPTYDLSTINEDPAQAIDINDPMSKVCDIVADLPECKQHAGSTKTLHELLSSFDPMTGQAQAVMEHIRGYDNYNWGYDPYHYTVPEGSYAIESKGFARLVEFRRMVQALHSNGFRVIMDVVYNHTFASGIAEKSVLDKIVPNYYHRYNPISGTLEMSTCCDNTATERTMMAKLMTDSLVVWARDYKIDGFRFDLMGHQPKAAMLEARRAVQLVDEDTYFYGEGWNFGEVANNSQFVQASQNELAGTEIGTFTDRLRDAIRGGNFQTGEFGLRHDQGVGNGLTVMPNERQDAYRQIDEYMKSMDQVKIGLAANLKSYAMINSFGDSVTGAEVPYGGGPAGYAEDPADTINYVSKHDNQTLWDNNQYRYPFELTTDQRVRMQLVSLSYPMLAQGIPFIHMGSELLRSKSFLRDSYDYGDWFNQVDFSYQTNNYNVGLPPAEKDGANWPVVEAVLKGNEGRDIVSKEHIQLSAAMFEDLLKIRTSSKLFRLRTAQQIRRQVTFLNPDILAQRGLVVMHIADAADKDMDPNHDAIIVVFNNSAETQIFRTDASNFELHPIQREGSDFVVKQASATDQGLTVPAMTTAVFVKPQ